MKKLVLLVCLAFCASSFAQSTASVAQTADEKKMIFQIQPVTDSSAQDQSYNEGAEVDLSVWNHQKDKKKDKSLNWTVAEIKKAQESAVKTNSNLTKEQEILKDVSIPKTRTLADNLNKALNDFINIDGSSLNTPGNAFHFETTPDGKTALYYEKYDERKIDTAKTGAQLIKTYTAGDSFISLVTNHESFVDIGLANDGKFNKKIVKIYYQTNYMPNIPSFTNSILIGDHGIIEQYICNWNYPFFDGCMIINPQVCTAFKQAFGKDADVLNQVKKCNQIKKGMQTFFDSKTILALAEKETSMSPRQNVHPSILYTGSRIKLDNNQDNQEDVREAYLRQLEMACGGKFHQGYITEEETMTTFEVNNPGAPSAIIFSN